MVLCLPVNVIVCVVLSIVGCPGVVLYKGAWAPGVGMTGWDRTVAIFLTKAMGFYAGVAAVPPGAAVPAVAVLGAGGSEMPNLVAGIVTTFPFSLPRPDTGPTSVPRLTAETLIYDR